MTYKTRKRIWPGALMSLVIAGALAVVVVLSVGGPQSASAHDCDEITDPIEKAKCLTVHDNEGEDHDQNAAPTVDAPAMDPILIPGVMDNGVNKTHTVDGVTAYFSDPDDDDLTFTPSSSNTAVATAVIEDGNLVITAQGAGNATITVTATDEDGSGMSVELDIEVTVRLSPAERYDLTPPSYEYDAPTQQQVTFTVSAVDADNTPLDEDATVNFVMEQFPAETTSAPLVTRVIGWDSSTDDDITDDNILQGLLTVRATDPDGERGFTVYFQCFAPGEKVEIDMYDEGPELVGESTISCKVPPDPPPPPDDKFRSDVMTVVSYNDWDHWDMYETVSDGFIIDDPDDNVRHIVNEGDGKVYDQMGVLVRDEPVVDDYQLAISDKEMLTLKAGEDPNRLAKAEAEAGQRTVEVQVGVDNVQLTVTSTMEGPAYIRFLDSDMQPFGDSDMDQDPRWAGADVVGLDSQGHLALNLMPNLTKAEALAYDQYRVVIPGAADGYAYLDGLAGDYHQGTFRFFNPCPRELGEDHHFYVEVYESDGKYLKTTEKVMCVLSPRPGPAGLTFKIDSQKAGEGVLEYMPARNATSHDVLLINAENRNIVTTVEDAESPVMFDNLNNGWTYHIVVVAEGVNGQYTADGVRNYHVEWLGEAVVPLSTAPSDAPDHTHPLCQTGYVDVMMLLAKCDTNTAPMAVGSIGAQTVMAGQSVTVDVASNFSDADTGDSLTYTATSAMMSYATTSVSGSMVTIMGVAAGSATVTVTATDMHGATAMQTIMVTVTAAELSAPTDVMARVDDSDPGVTNVTITWTNGMNADGHEVGLVDLSDYSVRDHRVTDGATSHTFTNVASGRYMAIVVSTMDADFEYDVDIVTVP